MSVANNTISPCVCFLTFKIYGLFYFPVPGAVISPVAFSFGKDWISLRWGAPYPPLGELEIYKVEYKVQSSWSYNRKEVSINEMCKLWDGNICLKLDSMDGITGNEFYNIKVSDIALISWLWEMKMLDILSLMEGFVSAVPKSIIIIITPTAKISKSFSCNVCCLFLMVHFFKQVKYRSMDC